MVATGKPWAKAASCVTYFVASSSMVLCNKGAVGIVSSMWGLVLFQNLVSVALYAVGGSLGLITMTSQNETVKQQAERQAKEMGAEMEQGKLLQEEGEEEAQKVDEKSLKVILQNVIMIAPINMLFVVMLFSSMQSLHHLSVPMVTVLKNLSNILTIVGDWHYYGNKIDMWVGMSACLIVMGAVMAGFNDLGLTTWGCIWMGVNTICTAAFNLYVKRCHNNANLTSVGMAVYNTSLSIPTILVVWSLELLSRDGNFGEVYTVISVVANCLIGDKVVLFLSGGIGTILGAAGMWCIAETSPTTYAFVGAMNKVGVTIVGAFIFGSLITSQGWIFVWMNIAGGMLYVASKLGVLKERKGVNSYFLAAVILVVIFLPFLGEFNASGSTEAIEFSSGTQNVDATATAWQDQNTTADGAS